MSSVQDHGPFVVENTDGAFVASFATQLLAAFFVEEGSGHYRHRAALSPDTSKVGAVDVREDDESRLDAAIVGLANSYTSENDVDFLAIVLMRSWGEADPRCAVSRYPASYVSTFVSMAKAVLATLRASPPPVEAGMVKPSRFGKQAEWWNGLTEAHRQAILRNAVYGREEAFNAGFDSACDAMLSAAPKDMEEGR